jgi:hypothetical protein
MIELFVNKPGGAFVTRWITRFVPAMMGTNAK